MKKYKAIISDVDGTLTQIKINSLPSQKVIQAIKKLKPLGIEFTLATGRPFHLIEKLIKDLDLTSPVITDNGAVITTNRGKILWEAVLPSLEAEDILNIGKKYGFTRTSTDKSNLDNPELIPAGEKVRKISIHDLSQEKADKLISEVEDKYKNISISKASSYIGIDYIDVYFSHANATKQHAVLEYSRLLNIATDEIIGIGDGYNDFPLLMACGLRVAMGNAVEDLKVIADFIAPNIDEDGLAVMLEKFVLK